MGLGRSLKKVFGVNRGGSKGGKAEPQEGQSSEAPQGDGPIARSVRQNQAAQQSGAAPQGGGMIANLARRSQATQPQEGGQTGQPTGQPSRRGFPGMLGGLLAQAREAQQAGQSPKEGGMKKGGSVSASKRADGCCTKGKTKGRMV